MVSQIKRCFGDFQVYFDDILIMGSHPNAIALCIDFLHMNFAIKDLGSLSYFLELKSYLL